MLGSGSKRPPVFLVQNALSRPVVADMLSIRQTQSSILVEVFVVDLIFHRASGFFLFFHRRSGNVFDTAQASSIQNPDSREVLMVLHRRHCNFRAIPSLVHPSSRASSISILGSSEQFAGPDCDGRSGVRSYLALRRCIAADWQAPLGETIPAVSPFETAEQIVLKKPPSGSLLSPHYSCFNHHYMHHESTCLLTIHTPTPFIMPAQFSPSSRSLPDLTGTVLDGNLKLVSILGAGSFGKVYKAIDLDSPAENPIYYAVKCLRLHKIGSKERQRQEQEVRHHKAVSDDPRVVSLHRSFTSGEFLFVVLEYAEKDVFQVMVGQNMFYCQPVRVKQASGEILDGVEAMHRCGIYHRDIKAENLLCDSDGKNIRIADFGLSTRKIRSFLFGCGSPAYMCPESLDRNHPAALEGFSPKDSDMWAIAVLFCTFVAGATPWQKAHISDPSYHLFLRNKDHLIHDLGLTKETNALLRRCFHKNPRMRPTLAEFRAAINAMDRFTLDDPLPPADTTVENGHPKEPLEPSSSSSCSQRGETSEEGHSTPPTSYIPSSSSHGAASAPRQVAKTSRKFPRRLFKHKRKQSPPPPSPEASAPTGPIGHRRRRSSLQLLAQNLGLKW
ncbi:Protein kinase domain-containing protein [Mycena indigotica]|uniref:Protein kinase domain-containing protein n=1 Tax=Mycena indigotica TaxID=2126181 RepID=A0A8H6WBK9_9AGAR|nr:Protein kinase domain-containing protein [Mycena indigotica]KAF7312734.1 Protein kinase domain-containing protein [Mycena indigotica]